MSECSSRSYSKILEIFCKVYHLDKCLKNPNHSVSLASQNPRIFYCSICDDCYGLDDSSPLDLLDIIKECNYLCLEKCSKCGNNDPNCMILDINKLETRLICKNCNEEVDLNSLNAELHDAINTKSPNLMDVVRRNSFDEQTDYEDNTEMTTSDNNSHVSSFTQNDDDNKLIDISNDKMSDEHETKVTTYDNLHASSQMQNDDDDKLIDNSDEANFVEISCMKCGNQKGFAIKDNEGKLKEVICTHCNRSNYFNSAKHAYTSSHNKKFNKHSRNDHDANDWRKNYLEKCRKEFEANKSTLPETEPSLGESTIPVHSSSKANERLEHGASIDNKIIFSSIYRRKKGLNNSNKIIDGGNKEDQTEAHDHECGYNGEAGTNNLAEDVGTSTNEHSHPINDNTEGEKILNNETNASTNGDSRYKSLYQIGRWAYDSLFKLNMFKITHPKDKLSTKTEKLSTKTVKSSVVASSSSVVVVCICDFISSYYPNYKDVIDTYKGPLAGFVQKMTYEILKDRNTP